MIVDTHKMINVHDKNSDKDLIYELGTEMLTKVA